MLRVNFQITSGSFISKGRFRTKFNKVVQGIGIETARELETQLVPIFGAPGPVVYPIQWTSDKQRKAFFASNGFGRGIPTKRTRKTESSWKVIYVVASEGGEITLLNTEPHAKYVYGDANGMHQQIFHKRTGWKSFIQARSDLLAKARQLAKTKFDEALGSFGVLEVEVRV